MQHYLTEAFSCHTKVVSLFVFTCIRKEHVEEMFPRCSSLGKERFFFLIRPLNLQKLINIVLAKRTLFWQTFFIGG